ncbi:MAG: glycosyltransferase family 2 protein [Bacteroidetes bacterium]|nr:glycosyltransferase family 2 protein [Bacteroidota bacterium]
MKVSGFTFVRNAVKFDYPVAEGIKSILPICDEVVVAVGNSEDATFGLIKSIGSPKIKIIETIWDDSLRECGKVLALETDKAFDAISPDSDWAFYMQADECFHENDLPKIKSAMEKWKDDKCVEGLVFNHINFYGTFDYYADSRKWNKKEVRVIRNDKNIRSWKDAMSFRKHEEKLNVKFVDALIYHYGWVKSPKIQQQKRESFEKLWHDEKYIQEKIAAPEFDYSKIDSVAKFTGSHPKVMQERIAQQNWKFEFDKRKAMKTSLRLKILNYIYQTTGIHIGEFRNYKII